MRIVIAGLAATYPLGGVFWDYLQYAQGLIDLGHEVLYLEDTGSWFYEPASQTMIESGAAAARWLGRETDRHLPVLSNSWLVRDLRGSTYGVDEKIARQFCQDAELFLNVSGATMLRPDDFPRAKSVFIDTDPMYNQRFVPNALAGTLVLEERKRLDRIRAYDLTFTFGENIGQPDCLIPDEYFDWIPTRQPVMTQMISRHRMPMIRRIRKLTTIGSWDQYAEPMTVAGRAYGGKVGEFLRFRDLPRRSELPLELAMAGGGPEVEMRSFGWGFNDPTPMSATADGYLNFLATSYAEWSVAKHAYVASKSGWFSGRTALYLALGVPAIVQDTGFSRFFPTGYGLLAFSTLEEAADAIYQVTANYARHCDAAEEIARTYFDSKLVLSKLLDDVFSNTSADSKR